MKGQIHALITITLDTAAWADSRPRKLAAGIFRTESRAGKDVVEERKTEDLIFLVRDAISTGNYRLLRKRDNPKTSLITSRNGVTSQKT